jgi:uridine kinase
MFEELIKTIVATTKPHPLRVGIDGASAVGKTRLADELATCMRLRGRPVIRASGDDFHFPKSIRHRRGRISPEGYYRDAFDTPTLISRLLAPLGPGGDGVYRVASHSLTNDEVLTPTPRTATRDEVLLFDGMFLQRSETREYFDCMVYLTARTSVVRARAITRDLAYFGTEDEVQRIYAQRYDPAQQLYLDEAEPETHANFVIENSDPAAPALRRGQARDRQVTYLSEWRT